MKIYVQSALTPKQQPVVPAVDAAATLRTILSMYPSLKPFVVNPQQRQYSQKIIEALAVEPNKISGLRTLLQKYNTLVQDHMLNENDLTIMAEQGVNATTTTTQQGTSQQGQGMNIPMAGKGAVPSM
jgi:hypothetical protein